MLKLCFSMGSEGMVEQVRCVVKRLRPLHRCMLRSVSAGDLASHTTSSQQGHSHATSPAPP